MFSKVGSCVQQGWELCSARCLHSARAQNRGHTIARPKALCLLWSVGNCVQQGWEFVLVFSPVDRELCSARLGVVFSKVLCTQLHAQRHYAFSGRSGIVFSKVGSCVQQGRELCSARSGVVFSKVHALHSACPQNCPDNCTPKGTIPSLVGREQCSARLGVCFCFFSSFFSSCCCSARSGVVFTKVGSCVQQGACTQHVHRTVETTVRPKALYYAFSGWLGVVSVSYTHLTLPTNHRV